MGTVIPKSGGGYEVRTKVRKVQVWDSSPEAQPSRNTWGGTPCERTGGTWAEKYGKKIIAWDVAPEQSYFDELFRVSRNQIIWGGNYFNLPPTRCFLIWKKFIPESFSMAMAEYAWTSFTGNAKMASERLEKEKAQTNLFSAFPEQKQEQITIF